VGETGDQLSIIILLFVLAGLIAFALFGPRVAKAGYAQDGPPDEPYRVYTAEFDLELPARQVLGRLRSASPDATFGWIQGGAADALGAIAARTLADQRARLAPEFETWVARIAAAAGDTPAADLAAAILIDQSGSMKGEPIAHAAAAAAMLADLLHAFGARSEILGFTTAGWHGGHAGLKWKDQGRPDRPGRLCALMHVVYKPAEVAELDEAVLPVLVHPDLLRENVDGEALLWAKRRLEARPEPHKLLIIVSDGAPVDDMTLSCNGPHYLYRHLEQVIHGFAGDPRFSIGGIGINHRVDSLYPLSETVTALAELPAAAVRLTEKMLAARNGR